MPPDSGLQSTQKFSLVPLIDLPNSIEECACLLNSEWPRSTQARMISLERSVRSTPPMSFVLIFKETGQVLGCFEVVRKTT